jgi:hypothetical protein
MKFPKYCVETMQQAIDLHLNAFALQLMAESFADAPELFGDENVVFQAHAHNHQPVWFIMSKTMPTAKDFDPAPPVVVAAPMPTTREEAADFFSRYGNVGDVAGLLRNDPEPGQLDEACAVATSRGQPPETVAVARCLISGGQQRASR